MKPAAHESGGALVPRRPSAAASSVALVDGPALDRGRGALARVDFCAIGANFNAALCVGYIGVVREFGRKRVLRCRAHRESAERCYRGHV